MNNQFISRYNAGDNQFSRTDTLQGHWPDDEGHIIIELACVVIAMAVLAGLCVVATL